MLNGPRDSTKKMAQEQDWEDIVLSLSICPGTDKAGIRRFGKWLEVVNSL